MFDWGIFWGSVFLATTVTGIGVLIVYGKEPVEAPKPEATEPAQSVFTDNVHTTFRTTPAPAIKPKLNRKRQIGRLAPRKTTDD